MLRHSLRSVMAGVTALASVLAMGCGAPGRPHRTERIAVLEDVLASVPDVQAQGNAAWILERSDPRGVYLVGLHETLPLQLRQQAALRLFVLSGRVRLRLGATDRTVAAGTFAAVPAGTAYRIAPAGRENPLLLMILTPDIQDTAIIEIPPPLLGAKDGRG